MARRKTSPAAPPPDQTLFQFSSDFFQLFGAQVIAGGPPGARTLDVSLSPDLAEHFGRPRLSLYFHGAEPQAGQELVAHGSRAFDRMLSLLEGRSAFSLLRLPPRVQGGEELVASVRPLNASIRDLRLQEQPQWLFIFHWRLTYRADDRRQELYSIVIDEDGRRVPLLEDTPGAPVQDQSTSGAKKRPRDSGSPWDGVDLNPTKWPATALGNTSAAGGAQERLTVPPLDLVQVLADGEPPVLERNEEGHILPPKLPPLTHLTRLAETARRYAIYHADLRCVSHEAEILPRLHKSLNRLTSYYQQQIEEVYDSHDPDGEKRRGLEADLNRKIAEEVENHRLHVQVELIGYVAVERPSAVLEMVLTDGKVSSPVRVVQDRYSGALHRPLCHSCGVPLAAAAVDQSGHLICDNCIEQCRTCGEIVCSKCGVESCPFCGSRNCANCGHACWACGGRACAEHISRCPTCGDEVCHACQVECSHCGVRQCRSHLYADAVSAGAAADGKAGEVQLICPACAVRCPGCSQYSVQIGTCAVSGQRFCRNCLVNCTECGRSVGPGFYAVSPINHKPYCQACQHECPTCGKVTPAAVACAECGSEGCGACRPRCSACARPLCAEHGTHLEHCGHILCAEHVGVCALGGEAVCGACSKPCPICGRAHCAEHTRVCVLCNQEYCSECVQFNGRCDTCVAVAKDGGPAAMLHQEWLSQPEVRKLIPLYKWLAESNARYTIYYGEGAMFNGAVIVVEHTGAAEKVVHTRRISLVDRMRGMIGL
jgi:hypothetical protein